MKPSVCIDMIGRELPEFTMRMKQARDCGYSAVEFWDWQNKDLSAVLSAKQEYGLEIAAFCTLFENPGDPSCRGAYLEGLYSSIETAKRLGCQTLISQAGAVVVGMSREAQRENLAETLRQSAELLKDTGVTLAVEPLNPCDHPGQFLVYSKDAYELLDAVNRPQIKLLFDLYHQQISEGNLLSNVLPHIEQIAHFHAAGNPGRHELTDNEVDYSYVLSRIRESGYSGYIGLEYQPIMETSESLRRMRKLFG